MAFVSSSFRCFVVCSPPPLGVPSPSSFLFVCHTLSSPPPSPVCLPCSYAAPPTPHGFPQDFLLLKKAAFRPFEVGVFSRLENSLLRLPCLSDFFAFFSYSPTLQFPPLTSPMIVSFFSFLCGRLVGACNSEPLKGKGGRLRIYGFFCFCEMMTHLTEKILLLFPSARPSFAQTERKASFVFFHQCPPIFWREMCGRQ